MSTTVCTCERPILVDERILHCGVRDIKCGRRIAKYPISLPRSQRPRDGLHLAR